MQKIEYLSIRFAHEIAPWELPAFRGAVVEHVGRERDLFHNHDNAAGGFHFRYPLIQYKRQRGKAALLCLQEGAEDFYSVFGGKGRSLTLGEREMPLRIEDLRMRSQVVGIWDQSFKYRIRDWIALNQDNYRKYTNTEGLGKRLEILERTLKGHLLAFLQGVGCPTDKPVTAGISELRYSRAVTYKGVKLLAFSLDFHANVSLPDMIGLGKGVSLGHGTVHKVRKRREEAVHV